MYTVIPAYPNDLKAGGAHHWPNTLLGIRMTKGFSHVLPGSLQRPVAEKLIPDLIPP